MTFEEKLQALEAECREDERLDHGGVHLAALAFRLLQERDEAWRQAAYWDEVERDLSLTCHCCGGDSADWTGYYSADGTEETRVFLCNNCSRIFLMQVMDDLNRPQCLLYLRRAQKDLRPEDLPERKRTDE